MKSIADKIKSDVAVLPDYTTEGILAQLNMLNDDLVITFLRCSMSVISGRMIEQDGKEIDEERWLEYHRKIVGLLLESLDLDEEALNDD